MSSLREDALEYHKLNGKPGKISILPTKPLDTQYDLALAYSPGVAEPVLDIAKDPALAFEYTSKGNLVAVVSNGTAILGLGNLGALASKPVMEGKGVLFKKFADIDVFDLEIASNTPQEFIETVVRIAPGFGGINLEDIAAPACFEIEKALIEQLDIPVFHDDQHGTAIITAAGLLNALELQGKSLEEARIVCIGAGAAGIASMRLLVALGAAKENIVLVDSRGVIHSGRQDLNVYKREFSLDTPKRTLGEALERADVFIGLSAPNVMTMEMVAAMAERPIIFALSNPDPEINPALAQAVRDDLIMATGRSDYPNQVNNVLGFPFIFRGALDVRASCINVEMQIAAVHALRALAREPVPEEVLQAYRLTAMAFGPGYILPKPLDARLLDFVPPAVARAAVQTGVAHAPYPDHYPKA